MRPLARRAALACLALVACQAPGEDARCGLPPEEAPPGWPTRRFSGEGFELDLPREATVVDNAADLLDFAVYRVSEGDAVLGGVYAGNFAAFPLDPPGWGLECREVRLGETRVVSWYAAERLVRREWLVRRPCGHGHDGPPVAGRPPEPPCWPTELHVWTTAAPDGVPDRALRTMATLHATWISTETPDGEPIRDR